MSFAITIIAIILIATKAIMIVIFLELIIFSFQKILWHFVLQMRLL